MSEGSSPIRTVHVPVILTEVLAATPMEKIDVIADFVSYKVAELTTEDLVDQLGAVKSYNKAVEKWDKLAVGVLKARMGTAKASIGKKYLATIRSSTRSALSKEKLIAKFGEAALADCYADISVDALYVTIIE